MLSVVELQRFAKEAGFDLCGFARAEPIPADTLTRWIEAGFDADMDWMGRRAAERLDVSLLLPGAKTVISFACNYHVEHAESAASPVAKYARGRDYHATMRDRLRAFRRALSAAHPEVQTYGGIDSGPLMEKVWAARAGIGYVAKSGCLMTEEFGSYVVLATLILDAAVDRYADGPAMDRCGGCTICISDCPTDAIQEDRSVDARRCLSYQTIENDQHVPTELRDAFSGIVFGCDICQTVCPLNRRTLPTENVRWIPRAVASLGVRELAALTKEQYEKLVPGTPLARAGFDGLRRNAAYAIGAAKDVDARPVLETLLADQNDAVREAAEWALGRLAG
ncbi:MAG: tRNA epoxyqueuosine(34) reductase QueG [Myxococcaceae bacterium]